MPSIDKTDSRDFNVLPSARINDYLPDETETSAKTYRKLLENSSNGLAFEYTHCRRRKTRGAQTNPRCLASAAELELSFGGCGILPPNSFDPNSQITDEGNSNFSGFGSATLTVAVPEPSSTTLLALGLAECLLGGAK